MELPSYFQPYPGSGVWCDVVFSIILWSIWGFKGSFNFFPTFITVLCRKLSFFVIQKLLILFLWRIIFAIFYIVISKNSSRWYYLLECKLNCVKIIMALKLITKTTREHVQFCIEVVWPKLWYTLYCLRRLLYFMFIHMVSLKPQHGCYYLG